MLVLECKIQFDYEGTFEEIGQNVPLSLGVLSELLLKDELLVDYFHGELHLVFAASRDRC